MRTPTLFALLITFNVFGQPGDQAVNVSEPFYVPVEKTIRVPLTTTTDVLISVNQYGNDSGMVYINLHDNEQSAVKATRAILEHQGGTLVKIENRGQRVIYFRLQGIRYGFDPNRIFSSAGIRQTLNENGRYSIAAAEIVERFAKEILSLLPPTSSCIIALHNNFDGAFSIESYLPGGSREKDARAVYANALEDIDDIILTTDSLLYHQMADAGYNSIWQDNENAKKDGSLSIYCGERNIRYVNIETEHGRVEQYEAMLRYLLYTLNDWRPLN